MMYRIAIDNILISVKKLNRDTRILLDTYPEQIVLLW